MEKNAIELKDNKPKIVSLWNLEFHEQHKETLKNRKQRRIKKYLILNDDTRDFTRLEKNRIGNGLTDLGKTIVYQQIGKGKKRRIVKKLADKNTLNLLVAHGNILKHARTSEIVIGVSSLEHKHIPRSKCEHLRRFPRKPYHNQTNKPCSRIFQSKDDLVKWINGDNINSRTYQGKPTKQYKLVFTTRHQRRQ